MAVVDQLFSYFDGSRMDSFTAGIVNISPQDAPLTSMRKTEKMRNTVHEVFYESLYIVTSTHSVIEGSSTSLYWNEPPTSKYILAETLRHAYKINDTEQGIPSKTGTDPKTRERMKAAKVIKNVWEERAILGTAISGATDTAQKMSGVVEQLSTYSYTNASLAWTASGMESKLENVWAGGALVDELYVPIKHKRAMATWVGSETVVNADAADRRIINKKDFYESDTTGVMKVFKSRVLSNLASAATASSASLSIVFGIQSDLVRNAVFDGTKVYENAPDADYSTWRGKMETKASVVVTNPAGGFAWYNTIP
jgi:hypothetical protein